MKFESGDLMKHFGSWMKLVVGMSITNLMSSTAAQKEIVAQLGNHGPTLSKFRVLASKLSNLASSSAWLFCFLLYRVC